MKLSEFRRLVPWSNSIGLTQIGAEMLLADIDAEIAKARGAMPVGPLSDRLSKQVVIGHTGSNIDRRVSSLAGGLDEVERRLAALEASEVELREHCQGNVPMSVFNALAERVKALEVCERATGKFDEDEAYDEWHDTPWPPSMLCKHERARLEQAFREGFRAGRK